MDDDRLPDTDRIELSPSEGLVVALLTEAYPADEYPEVQSIQDAFERAAADIIRLRRHNNLPLCLRQDLSERDEGTEK